MSLGQLHLCAETDLELDDLLELEPTRSGFGRPREADALRMLVFTPCFGSASAGAAAQRGKTSAVRNNSATSAERGLDAA
mmetsp:Transcript_10017/g.22470  ORF Transcript_10017/g.22470 Transcript_10017/m.22470 type:complete len:80 (-) Transcript_10017:125-364(-)